jgi:glycosyltransferase involved in cell wall biosynthesis
MATVVRGLLSSPLSERYAMTSITTHRPGSARGRTAVALRGGLELWAWCRTHPEGIVHVHSAVRGSLYRKAFVVLLARAFRRPVLFHLHAGPGDIRDFADGLTPARHSLLAAALRRAQAIVSVSAASSQTFASVFGLDEVGVIANAAPSPPADAVPPQADTALYLGGFEDPAKGGADLVDALPALLRAAPTIKVALAGPGDPPSGLRQIDNSRVRWLGWLDAEAKRAALSEAGIVLIPSRSEGMPVVLLEAMAYGRAIVATRVGGIPERTTDDVDCVLIEPGDPEAFARVTAELAQDDARVRRLGAAARDRVAAYGESDIIARIDATYQALLER